MTTRLIHTSDWHLGHVLHDVDQGPEQRAFLDWLVAQCEQERAHGLLVAGDLFDVSNPPATAVAMLARFLMEVWRRLPKLQVVAIGGNHDSAHRLETTEPFLSALGRLHVLGAVPRQGGAIDTGRALIRIEGDGDSVLVAAVPFLRAADLRVDDLGGDPATPVRRVHDELFAAARAQRRQGEALVAMGHLFVTGGATGGAERQLVGGVDAVPADAFPPDVAYAALGHLHRPQTIAGRLRYSGTPIPLSFDEAAYAQEITVVALEAGGLKSTRSVPVPRTRPLLQIPGAAHAPLSEVLSLLRALPARGDLADELVPLLEVRVLLERPEPTLRGDLEAALAGRAARLVKWPVKYTGSGAGLADAAPSRSLSDLDPVEVFKMRWAKVHGGEPGVELLAAFDALLAEARGEVAAGQAAAAAEVQP